MFDFIDNVLKKFNFFIFLSIFLSFALLSMQKECIKNELYRLSMIEGRKNKIYKFVRDISSAVMNYKDLFVVDKRLLLYERLALDSDSLKNHDDSRVVMKIWQAGLQRKNFAHVFTQLTLHKKIKIEKTYVDQPIYNFLMRFKDDAVIERRLALIFLSLLMLRDANPNNKIHNHRDVLYLLPRMKDQKFACYCADLFYLWGVSFDVKTPLGYTPLQEAYAYKRKRLITRFKKFGMYL